jgi:hypothetical protein
VIQILLRILSRHHLQALSISHSLAVLARQRSISEHLAHMLFQILAIHCASLDCFVQAGPRITLCVRVAAYACLDLVFGGRRDFLAPHLVALRR